MHALARKLLHRVAARGDIAVVRVVDDDLAALDGEKVPDLVLELVLDSLAQLYRVLGDFACGLVWWVGLSGGSCRRRAAVTTRGYESPVMWTGQRYTG